VNSTPANSTTLREVSIAVVQRRDFRDGSNKRTQVQLAELDQSALVRAMMASVSLTDEPCVSGVMGGSCDQSQARTTLEGRVATDQSGVASVPS
jgi:hypothetical protein